MKTILFQGDSITDAVRNRENFYGLGHGYANFVAGRLGLSEPGAYQFLNRGVSGDRIVDIYARMKRDILNLKPDVMSLLVGVNDVWHEQNFANGVNTEKYKKIYGMLLDEIQEALPETKLILLVPFTLKGSATEENYDWFRSEVEAKAAVVKELAVQRGLPFIPLQESLDRLAENAPDNYYLADGVHPTAAFHQYIADRWMEVFDHEVR